MDLQKTALRNVELCAVFEIAVHTKLKVLREIHGALGDAGQHFPAGRRGLILSVGGKTLLQICRVNDIE